MSAFVAILLVVLALVGVALATWAHLWFWTRRLTLAMDYAEMHRVATADGSAIELRRLPSLAPAELGQVPVLLVHGIAINHRNLDLHPDFSLARKLAAAGRDVWLLTLRSGRTDLGLRERRKVRFAAMTHHDVPLAVAEVLQRTGAQHLDYVGFSMGGMLLYAALGRTLPESQVRRAVILGSPGRVAPIVPLLGAGRVVPVGLLPGVPLRFLSRLAAFASEWFPTPLHAVTLNLRNSQPGLSRLTMVDAVVDVPGALAFDFLDWAYTDGVVRVGGKPILDGLAQVVVPVHFFAGVADRLGAPGAVRLAFDAWGSESGASKHFTLLGAQHGHGADYGHGDMAIGKRAMAEVFAPVEAFLAAADAAGTAPLRLAV